MNTTERKPVTVSKAIQLIVVRHPDQGGIHLDVEGAVQYARTYMRAGWAVRAKAVTLFETREWDATGGVGFAFGDRSMGVTAALMELEGEGVEIIWD